MHTKTRLLTGLVLALVAGAIAAPPSHAAQAVDLDERITHTFSKWTTATPGCAIGVLADGKTTFRAFGLADLEHAVPITPGTIFEAGSVSKQFTAAAVLLLAKDGKLSLDDPARKYIPELPDYGTPLTIRQMLTHTSGLRDWGGVASIAGSPRGSRVHTHADVLDIVGRQRALNFSPGTKWSYSNTGYNLAAIIVSRVSGMPFEEFIRKRIFEPLGMMDSSWDVDHTRVVPRRAVAYSEQADGFHTFMPFEDVHGNRGLLTTVGDLLKWNENFVSPRVGDLAFVRELEQPGRLNDGRAHGYALGLVVGQRNGVREISHNGATAGYRAELTRYPDQHVSVAVLCNVGTATPTDYSRAVSALYLPLEPDPSPPQAHILTADQLADVIGLYRHSVTGVPLTLSRDQGRVRLEFGGFRTTMIALSGSRFLVIAGFTLEADGGDVRLISPFGSVERFVRASPVRPAVEELRQYAGTYASDEAQATIAVIVEDGSLVLKRRPGSVVRLTPLYADAFSTPALDTFIFRRDPSGKIEAMSVVQDRVWDLRFTRQTSRP
jgi:CubicO group peptidase (beta-lactamase class C family)